MHKFAGFMPGNYRIRKCGERIGVDGPLKRIYPNAYAGSLVELKSEFFLHRGIKGLIFDLDNTIVPWSGTEFPPEVLEALSEYKDAGLKICVVSNALNRRVAKLIDPLDLPYIGRARKPRRRAFLEAMHILGTKPQETAVIGDQLFTDVLGGNRSGCFTILVVPMSKKDFFATRIVRMIEKVLLRRIADEKSN